jgi:Spy/CpxP family protein refolding chaperone
MHCYSLQHNDKLQQTIKDSAMKTKLFTVVVAAALSSIAVPALAHGDMGSPLGMLAKVKSQLNLNTSQQQQWDAVMAQSKAAHAAARASFAPVKSAMQAELAKSAPDFATVASLSDSARQQNEALHKQTRDAWLALYANFTPEQKALARDTIKAGMDRMAARRAAHGSPASSTAE